MDSIQLQNDETTQPKTRTPRKPRDPVLRAVLLFMRVLDAAPHAHRVAIIHWLIDRYCVPR